MKLYHFGEWNRRVRAIQLAEWETDEVLFRNEFANVEKSWNVIDVGSEFGYYAIKAGLLVGSEGKVLAIEAHPETYRLLRMNVRLYMLNDRVVPICKAVGKETGKAKLYETTSPGSTSIVPPQSPFKVNKNRLSKWLKFAKANNIFSIIPKRFAPSGYVVPMDTLERIASQHYLENIHLVKIDVEGAELDVLKGSQDILERYRPLLLIEVHFNCGWKPEVLYEFLEEFGYSLTIEKRPDKAHVIARPMHRASKHNRTRN